MNSNTRLRTIRDEIENKVGQKVTLRDRGGRRKIFVNSGVIEKTYPSIFVVKLEGEKVGRISYSYSDVLTETVQLVYVS